MAERLSAVMPAESPVGSLSDAPGGKGCFPGHMLEPGAPKKEAIQT